MDRYRSGAYADDNPDWHEADAPDKVRSVAALLRFAGGAPRSVVEVGCGTGAVLAGLCAELAHELPDTSWEGWDPAPLAIARARVRERPRLAFVEGDLLASERRADLILCLDVVEHVPSDLDWLRALRERAPTFVFRIPLDLSVLDVVRPRRMLDQQQRLGHLHAYTRERARNLLEAAGYRVDMERYDRVPPPTDSARRRWVDRVRRSAFALAPHTSVRWLGGFSWLVLARS